jgi:hypothetical protein
LNEAARRAVRARPVGFDGVPARFRRILAAVPVRNEDFLKWELDSRGLVTITHAKNLREWERWLMKRLGGSPILKRKLDGPGSDIWVLCDGEHDVSSICTELDRKYKERIEPVLTRVVQFLEILLARNLVYLRTPSAPEKGDIRTNRARKRTPAKSKGGGK